MLHDLNENDLVQGIEEAIQEDKTPESNPYDPITVHIIPDEGEIARNNENINSSEPTYLNKGNGKDKSACDCVK